MMHEGVKQFLNRIFRLGAIALLPVGVFGLPEGSSVRAAQENPFAICASELIEANVSEAEASTACSEALEPKDLSWCVLKIYDLTPIDGDSALRACFRARRPLELAHCAIDVTEEFQERERGAVVEDTRTSLALSTLDNCRRSLLPERFADCAIGLSREIDLSAPKILNVCIEAEAFPPLLFPQRAN